MRKQSFNMLLIGVLAMMFFLIGNQPVFGQIRLGPALSSSAFLSKGAKFPIQSYSIGASIQFRKHSISAFYEKVTHPFFASYSDSPQGMQLNYRYKIARIPLSLDFFAQTNFHYFSFSDLFSRGRGAQTPLTEFVSDVFMLNLGIGLDRKIIGDVYLSIMVGGGAFYDHTFYAISGLWGNGRGANYAVQLSARYLFTLKE